MSPDVSIILPIYNVETYLRQSIDSTGLLGRKDVEIILVNDGSTDNSGAICREYAERWTNVVLVEKPNGGLSDARNYGTEAAKGAYIYYLDSDDWLCPGAIETLFRFAVKENCDIVQGGFYYAFDGYDELDNRYLSEQAAPFVLNRQEAMRELLKNNFIKNFAWGKLYRAEIVKRHRFPVGKFFEDSYWQHQVVADVNRYGVVPEPMYYYRQRTDGISGKAGLRALHLLEGNEERLRFVRHRFPELESIMADELWNSAFWNIRFSKQKEFWEALERITKEYKSSFSRKLRYSPSFIYYSLFKGKFAWKQFLFLLKVYEHFTSKRLTRIDHV